MKGLRPLLPHQLVKNRYGSYNYGGMLVVP
jgi:hypothetical protein